MAITVVENVAAAATAATFVSLPAGRVILVWGTEALTGGTALALPSTIARSVFNMNPTTIAGGTNQFSVAGLDITPASAPLTYTIGGIGGAFSSGGFELDGLEATDINALCDGVNHTATAFVPSGTSASIAVPGTWNEDEGFLFVLLQTNGAITAPIPTGFTVSHASTSRLVGYRVLGAGDKGTKPSVSLSWTTARTAQIALVLLKPPQVAPPTAPDSVNLIFARQLAENVKTDADALQDVVYTIEPLIDAYETETGATSTTALRRKYYGLRRALAELQKMPDQVQAEIDILQGTATPVDTYKIVYDTTSPFVNPVTDLVGATTFSVNTWVGVRTSAGAVPQATINVKWWWDTAFNQASPTLTLDKLDGPDWSFSIPRGVNGLHTLYAQVETVDENNQIIAIEQHSFDNQITTSGAGANSPPVVNAGTDQSVTAGAVPTLTASATDPDGDTLVTADAGWTQVSGPATLSPAPPTASNIWKPNCIIPGAYVLEARWRDPKGATGVDQKTLTVTSAGGAGGLAKARLGLFPRLDGGYPQNDENLALLEGGTYLNRRVYAIRETIDKNGWGFAKSNFRFHLSDPTGLAAIKNRSPNPIIYDLTWPLFALPEISGAFTRAKHRDAWQRCAAGAFDTHWDDFCEIAIDNGWGTTTANLWLDFLHEYDLAGSDAAPCSIQGGNVDVAVAAAIHVSQYMKAQLPNLKIAVGIDSYFGPTSKPGGWYLDANDVPTNKKPQQVFEEEMAKHPGGFSRYFDAYYCDVYSQGNTAQREAFIQAAYDQAVRFGTKFAIPEWGMRVDTGLTDTSNRDFCQMVYDFLNALPASGPGSLQHHCYFEGWPPAGLLTKGAQYPLTRARFLSLYGS